LSPPTLPSKGNAAFVCRRPLLLYRCRPQPSPPLPLRTQRGGGDDDEKLAEDNNGGGEDVNDGVEMTAK
jgi:hypothetical protein